MAKAIWAMDFGAWSLKVVRAVYDKKEETITVEMADEIRYGELPCGYDASPLDKHRESAREFSDRYEIGAGDNLCVSVTGSEVFSRFIKLPPTFEKIGQIIRYEARQQIPFDIESVIWDWQTVKEQEQIEEGEEVEVGLFALKRERADELMEVLEPWRNNLRVIQDAPLAVYNLLEYEQRVEQPLVVLDLGAATTDVLVLNPPRFWVRSLLVAGNDLTNALVERFGVSVEEGEQIKRRAAQSEHYDQIMTIVNPVFDEIAKEIQRSLGYYKSLAREVKFERILLLGSTMRMAGVQRSLARRLQYDVDTLSELKRIQVADSAEGLQEAMSGFGACLGLVVQGADQARIKINLVPEKIALAGAVSEKKPWLLAGVAGLLLAAILLILGEQLYAREIQNVNQRFDWRLVEKLQELQDRYQSQTQEVQKLKNLAIVKLAQPGVDPDVHLDVLEVLSSTLPRDVYLDSMSLRWQEPDQLTNLVAAAQGGKEEEKPEAARSGSAELSALMESRRGTGRSAAGVPAPKARAAAAGFATGDVEPVLSAESKLVLFFAAESRVVRKGEEFIRKRVIEALEQAKFPGENRTAFEEVHLVGGLRDVWRNPLTGEEAAAGSVGAEHFVAFNALAVVNAAPEGQEK